MKTDKQKINSETLISQTLGSYENDTIFVKYPNGIKIKDSLLFMLSSSSGHFINVYSYPELKFITYVGIEGKSNEELLSVGDFDVDDEYLYLIDISSKKLIKYSLKNIILSNNRPTEVIMLNDINIPALSYAKTKFGFISTSTIEDRYLLIDNTGKKIKSFGSLPVDKSNDVSKIDPVFIPSLWNVSVDYDEKHKLFVAAAHLGDVIEIYNTETDECNVIVGEGGMPSILTNGTQMSVGKIDGYFDIKIVDNQIYALYSGADREKLIEQWRKGENTPAGGSNIKVYSLDGKQKKHYVLDRYITGFDVDIKNKKIIAIDSDNALFCGFDLESI